ncbi:MAG TPA: tRNA glutamyl-Q(34) synthetase GluQRS, partial [Chthoniobacterales bacterium]
MTNYRGRIAPSPTGYLHLGHAMTFWRAQERCRAREGRLVLRIEDLDRDRCRPEFRDALVEDLQWFGIEWDEGPYLQSERVALYRDAFEKLRARGFIYACTCSRRDVLSAAGAPHNENDEPVYPGTCREKTNMAGAVNWRFRVPDGELLQFDDGGFGLQRGIAGGDFGDFLVWRKDDVPAYQLAVVVDDANMQISEVVRGADLLISTFRQLLIYRALDLTPPAFYHTPLITNEAGKRLAKRDDALSLRTLRASGISPHEL